MTDSTENEALEILQTLVSRPFEDCIPVGREFPTLTTQHSIYAIRHRAEGLLYIGKAQESKATIHRWAQSLGLVLAGGL